jgi:hypothetical protein
MQASGITGVECRRQQGDAGLFGDAAKRLHRFGSLGGSSER